MNEEIKTLFEDFLTTYQLSPRAEEFYNLVDQIIAGLLSKEDFVRAVIQKFKLPIAKTYSIKASLEAILSNPLVLGIQALLPSGPSDVEPENRREDVIFHDLLNFIKGLNFYPDQEKKLFNIFISYLKGVRNEIEISETIQKEDLKGGLALSPMQSQPIIDKFNETVKNLNTAQFSSDYASSWFRKHYDTIFLTAPITSHAGPHDLLIAPENEPVAPSHKLEIPLGPKDKTIQEMIAEPSAPVVAKSDGVRGHDFNLALKEHIEYHEEIINAMPEIAAPEKPAPIALAAPVVLKELPQESPVPLDSASFAKETLATEAKSREALRMTAAPAPFSPVIQRPAAEESKRVTSEMNKVEMKPVIAPVVSDDLRQKRVVPEPLRRMVDQEAAASATVIPKALSEEFKVPTTSLNEAVRETTERITPHKKRPGFFSRLFQKKSAIRNPQFPNSPILESSNVRVAEPARPIMSDITYAPKLYTPIDELASLSLADFRRLARDPGSAIKKISDKLDLLAHESFEMKAEGIIALKKSGLYKDYSDIMNASVTQGRPFTQIIAERKTLTEPEFKALSQLNRELRS